MTVTKKISKGINMYLLLKSKSLMKHSKQYEKHFKLQAKVLSLFRVRIEQLRFPFLKKKYYFYDIMFFVRFKVGGSL